MQDLHAKMDMLLMTSAWEGFPMVIMEAMSFGVICNVCAVDEIPNYIIHQQTGLIIDEVNDEAKIIEQAIGNIKWMIANSDACAVIRNEAFQIAQIKFSRSRFIDDYRSLFEN